jgi:hypothetical protein
MVPSPPALADLVLQWMKSLFRQALVASVGHFANTATPYLICKEFDHRTIR